MPATYHRNHRDYFSMPGQTVKDWYDNQLLPGERQGEWTPEPDAIEGEESVRSPVEQWAMQYQNEWGRAGYSEWLSGAGVPYSSRQIEEIRTADSYPFWRESNRPVNNPDVLRFERFGMTLQLPRPEYLRYQDALPWDEHNHDIRQGHGLIHYPGGGVLTFRDPQLVPQGLWLFGRDLGEAVSASDLREFRDVCDYYGEFSMRDREENMSLRPTDPMRYTPTRTRRVKIVRLQLPASSILFSYSNLFLLMEC